MLDPTVTCDHWLCRSDFVEYACTLPLGHEGNHWNSTARLGWASGYFAEVNLPSDPQHSRYHPVRVSDSVRPDGAG